MRSAIVVAVVLVAGMAKAEPMSDDGRFGSFPLDVEATSIVRFYRTHPLPGSTELFSLTLPAGNEARTIALNESTIGDYGATWAQMLAWANTHPDIDGYIPLMKWFYGSQMDQEPLDIANGIVAPQRLGSFTIESLRFRYILGNLNPVATLLWDATGDGTVVPEPASVLLLVVGLCLVSRRHGRASI